MSKASPPAVTRIIWSPQAIEDVEAVRAYVARDSPRYADLLVERLYPAVERLEPTRVRSASSLRLATTRFVR